MPALTKLIFNQSEDSFLQYTETLDEVSLLVDERLFRSLLSTLPSDCGVTVSPHSFRAISVSEGEIESMVSFDVTTGLVSAMSHPLAAANISIFYCSTYQTDYVVIKSSQVELAKVVLKQQFGEDNVDVEDESGPGESTIGEDDSDDSSELPLNSDPNARRYQKSKPLCATMQLKSPTPAIPSASATDSSAAAPAATSSSTSHLKDPLKLHAMSQSFFLAHFHWREIQSNLSPMLPLFFFPPTPPSTADANADIPDRFFSYSLIDGSVSMMLDRASLAVLNCDPSSSNHVSFETWRGVSVAAQFGFDETGIVAALSSPLTDNKVCPFYLSTYFTDYVLVQESKWKHAETILGEKFNFIPRKNVNNSSSATDAPVSGSLVQQASVEGQAPSLLRASPNIVVQAPTPVHAASSSSGKFMLTEEQLQAILTHANSIASALPQQTPLALSTQASLVTPGLPDPSALAHATSLLGQTPQDPSVNVARLSRLLSLGLGAEQQLFLSKNSSLALPAGAAPPALAPAPSAAPVHPDLSLSLSHSTSLLGVNPEELAVQVARLSRLLSLGMGIEQQLLSQGNSDRGSLTLPLAGVPFGMQHQISPAPMHPDLSLSLSHSQSLLGQHPADHAARVQRLSKLDELGMGVQNAPQQQQQQQQHGAPSPYSALPADQIAYPTNTMPTTFPLQHQPSPAPMHPDLSLSLSHSHSLLGTNQTAVDPHAARVTRLSKLDELGMGAPSPYSALSSAQLSAPSMDHQGPPRSLSPAPPSRGLAHQSSPAPMHANVSLGMNHQVSLLGAHALPGQSMSAKLASGELSELGLAQQQPQNPYTMIGSHQIGGGAPSIPILSTASSSESTNSSIHVFTPGASNLSTPAASRTSSHDPYSALHTNDVQSSNPSPYARMDSSALTPHPPTQAATHHNPHHHQHAAHAAHLHADTLIVPHPPATSNQSASGSSPRSGRVSPSPRSAPRSPVVGAAANPTYNLLSAAALVLPSSPAAGPSASPTVLAPVSPRPGAAASSLFAGAALIVPGPSPKNNPAPAPATNAAAQPTFESLFPVDQLKPLSAQQQPQQQSVNAAAGSASGSAVPIAGSIVPFTSATFGHLSIEKLACFVDVEKDEAARLLSTNEHAPYSPQNAVPSNPYDSTLGQQSEGLFLFRPCRDPSEALADGRPNPNLFVLCYNKSGKLLKSKVFRLQGGLSLGMTGHRLFPTIYDFVNAIVGNQARPVA